MTLAQRRMFRVLVLLQGPGRQLPRGVSDCMAVLAHEHDFPGVGHWNQHHRTGMADHFDVEALTARQRDRLDADREHPPREHPADLVRYHWLIHRSSTPADPRARLAGRPRAEP